MKFTLVLALATASSVYSGSSDNCTAEDMFGMFQKDQPLFENCSSALDLPSSSTSTATSILPDGMNPKSQDDLDKICNSPACVYNLNYVFRQMPNCLIGGVNMFDMFKFSVNALCNTMPDGALTTNGDPCNMVDLGTVTIIGMLPIWTNCSSGLSFENLPNVTSSSAVLIHLMQARTKDGNKIALEIPTCVKYLEASVARMPDCVMRNEDGTTANPIRDLFSALALNAPTTTLTPTQSTTTTVTPTTTKPSLGSFVTCSRSFTALVIILTIVFA